MECNKDEALRAKTLAERKMLEKNFAGARKMVSKAQKLYPGLDNILQMFTVCEVHCAAGRTVAGEIDWYGVLQVPPFTSDAMLIKRQYRKLALLLHPDKNKFAGAEAAFKLVGEANTTLTDSSRRCAYDMKRKASVRVSAAAAAAGSSPAYQQQSWRAGPVRPNTTHVHQQHEHQASTSAGSQSQTCWSICFICGMQCQTFGLYCSNCKDEQGVSYGYGANQQPNGVYSNAGAPQNHRGPQTNVAGQQASNHATSGVHASFGVPYNFPGRPANVADWQQASYYESLGVYGYFGAPQNFPGWPINGADGQQASYYASPGFYGYFGAPHNFPGQQANVACGQRASNYATPGVQAKPGTHKSMYKTPRQPRAPAPHVAARKQRVRQQQGPSAVGDAAKVERVKPGLAEQQNTL